MEERKIRGVPAEGVVQVSDEELLRMRDVKKDPLIEQYKRRLRKMGLENPEEYINMLDTVADQIEIATRMDPFF